MTNGTELSSKKMAPSFAHDDQKRSFWIVFKRSVQIAGCVDILFFFLFYLLGSPILAWVNVLSLSMYIAAYVCLSRRMNWIAVWLFWTEVLSHAAFGTVIAGWDSGFHYFLLIFIPAVFVSTKTSSARVAFFVLWCFYIGLDLLMKFRAPLEPLHVLTLSAVRYFNITVVFGMLAYLASYYYRTIVATQKTLNQLATTDSLTGVFNRRHIVDVAEYEALQKKRNSEHLSFILADIDHFKSVNDNYGHGVGDEVLVAVSQAIKSSIREQDSIARWGGEEFLIVLPDTNLVSAELTAHRIRENVSNIRFVAEMRTIMVTVTLGVSAYRVDDDIKTAIGRADKALYMGKRAGRNRVVTAESTGDSDTQSSSVFPPKNGMDAPT